MGFDFLVVRMEKICWERQNPLHFDDLYAFKVSLMVFGWLQKKKWQAVIKFYSSYYVEVSRIKKMVCRL